MLTNGVGGKTLPFRIVPKYVYNLSASDDELIFCGPGSYTNGENGETNPEDESFQSFQQWARTRRAQISTNLRSSPGRDIFGQVCCRLALAERTRVGASVRRLSCDCREGDQETPATGA